MIKPRDHNTLSPTSDDFAIRLDLLCDRESVAWIGLESNRSSWQTLYDNLEGSLPYLSPQFCRIWYAHYAKHYELLLVAAYEANGELAAIMPLVRRGDEITMVGDRQAQYHSWLCQTLDPYEFFARAIAELTGVFPTARIHFKYVLPGLCAEALKSYANTTKSARIIPHKRPIYEFDVESISATLEKNSNRSDLDQLERSGTLELKRITSAADYEKYFVAIAAAYDFRRGAKDGSRPYFEDPRTRRFHQRWMLSCPHDTLFSVMTIDDDPVAAIYGVVIGGVLVSAILVEHPKVAAYSGSELHIYMLAKELIGSTITQLDLTPGEDARAVQIASRHDDVFEFQLQLTTAEISNSERRQQKMRAEKGASKITSLTSAHLREVGTLVTRINPRSVARRIKSLLWSETEHRIYKREIRSLDDIEDVGVARLNELGDLVAYDETVSWSSRHAFLADATDRLTRGELAYTVREGDYLGHIGWVNPNQQTSFFTEVAYRYRYPDPGIVLYDFFTHPKCRGRGLYQKTLQQILHDLARFPDPPEFVYISVLANNRVSRHVIEKLNFEYIESIVQSVKFGTTRHDVCRC